MRIDFSSYFEYVFDQGKLNSCTSEALCMLVYYCLKKSNYPPFIPSSLYLYYNTRLLMNITHKDSGSYTSAAFSALENYGVCPESMWPFYEENVLMKPPDECYLFAKSFPLNINYQLIDSIEEIFQCLQNHQTPLLASIVVFNNQHIDNDDLFLKIDFSSKPKNMHSVLIIGIDTQQEFFIIMNSYALTGKSFFYLTFQDFLRMNEPVYVVDISFNHGNMCPAVLFDQMIQKPDVIYDHVIIGNGISAFYLIHHLQTDQSILLLTTSPCTKSSFLFDDTVLETWERAFSPTSHPLLYDWIQELGIDLVEMVEMNEYYEKLLNKRIIQKTRQLIQNNFGDLSILENRVSLLSDYRHTSLRHMLSELSDNEFEEYCEIVKAHFQSFHLIHHPPNFLIHWYLEMTTDYMSIKNGTSVLYDVDKFELTHYENVNITPLTSSDTINVKFPFSDHSMIVRGRNVYYCDSNSRGKGLPPIKRIIDPLVIYFYTEGISSEFDNTIIQLWGRISKVSDRIIRVQPISYLDSERIRSCLSKEIIRNNIFYPVFHDLRHLMDVYPLEFRIMAFVVCNFENNKNAECGYCDHDDYRAILNTAIASEHNVHYLAPNYSTMFYLMEGSLEMCHLLLHRT